MRQACGSGTDWAEIASTLLAAAALIVAAASYYVTAGRRPAIEVQRAPHPYELSAAGWRSEDQVPIAKISLRVYVTNVGTAATFLEELRLVDLDCRMQPGEERLWVGFGNGRPDWELPVSFGPGEANHTRIRVDLQQVEIKDRDDYVARLTQLRAVSIRVEWTFRRRRLLKFWQSETAVKRSHPFALDLAEMRESVASMWENRPNTKEQVRRLRDQQA